MTPAQHKLVAKITASTTLYDPKDSTVIYGNRETAKRLKVSASYIDQLFRTMVKEGMAKKVDAISSRKDNIENPRVNTFMLNPEFYGNHSVHIENHFKQLMWVLSSHDAASAHVDLERSMMSFIDPLTGEMEDMPRGYLSSVRRYENSYMFDKAIKHRKNLGGKLSTYEQKDDYGYPQLSFDELGIDYDKDKTKLNTLLKELDHE